MKLLVFLLVSISLTMSSARAENPETLDNAPEQDDPLSLQFLDSRGYSVDVPTDATLSVEDAILFAESSPRIYKIKKCRPFNPLVRDPCVQIWPR